jgi:GT2 family glycosyltransferase
VQPWFWRVIERRIAVIKVLWLAVTYNSDKDALNLVHAVRRVGLPPETALELELLDTGSADASPLAGVSQLSVRDLRFCHIAVGGNRGYFGAARWRYGQLPRPDEFDWIIVSNVDLEIRDQALYRALAEVGKRPEIGVLAPQIISMVTGTPQNPLMRSRPTHWRMRFHRLISSHWVLFNIYAALREVRRRLFDWLLKPTRAPRGVGVGEPIYAPHGSLIAFHRRYYASQNPFEHDAFLFNEEITVAETARARQLEVTFLPEIVIWHREHASTGWFRGPTACRTIHEAADMAVKKYFET